VNRVPFRQQLDALDWECRNGRGFKEYRNGTTENAPGTDAEKTEAGESLLLLSTADRVDI